VWQIESDESTAFAGEISTARAELAQTSAKTATKNRLRIATLLVTKRKWNDMAVAKTTIQLRRS
jgi:hypothetical protein